MSELIAECSMRTTAQRLLIVNADDYGYSQQVNAAIEKSFELELISSATLMANMPGFMHAVMWLKRQPIQPAIGVHLNLDEGLPLTSMFRELPGGRNLFYNGNALTSSSRYLRAAECELDAQIQRVLDAGIMVHHFDSHHHIHTRLPLTRIVVRLARRYGIRFVRMSRTLGGKQGWPISFYRAVVNSLLRSADPSRENRGFAGLSDLIRSGSSTQYRIIEAMIHPGKESEFAVLLSPGYSQLRKSYRLVSYVQLTKPTAVAHSH